MSLQFLIDMNLSVEWIVEFGRQGWSAVHWSKIGDPKAEDQTIMDWALSNGFIVFTHDLDFGTLLALTYARGPSVVQVRGQNVLPEYMGLLVGAAVRQYETELTNGALVVVEESKSRVRVLPLKN